MSETNAPAEWYYVGHYGQLGPLTLTQMKELAGDGVVMHDTYVWRQGMSDWTVASRVPELKDETAGPEAPIYPPAPPTRTQAPPMPPATPTPFSRAPAATSLASTSNWQYIQAHAPKSDKSRILGGILNLFLPGIGRLYMGYAALGAIQLILFFCMGIGLVWSFFDGIYMLVGGVKFDGYGRRLED
jgi:TM2 domain-containing membrane protein YozV